MAGQCGHKNTEVKGLFLIREEERNGEMRVWLQKTKVDLVDLLCTIGAIYLNAAHHHALSLLKRTNWKVSL